MNEEILREEIKQGIARRKYGLATNRLSRYHALRNNGLSDEKAQFQVFKTMIDRDFEMQNV